MKVIVTFALRSELAPWLRLRPFCRAPLGRYASYETLLAGSIVRALLTGVGPAHACDAIRAALETRPDVVLASGLCGALNPSLEVGEILAPRLVRFEGTDQALASSSDWLDLAVRCGAQAVDAFISTPAVAGTVEAKAALSSYADAVDMESFPILDEALRAGIPALALRCVSDASHTALPWDFSRLLDARGRLSPWQLALLPLRAPHAIPSVLRFARASHGATLRLAQFLDLFLWKALDRP
jgi:nucleoside phosphorylase